jgi:hypothetical protein
MTRKAPRGSEKQFDQSVKEAWAILKRTQRLIRHVDRGMKLIQEARKSNLNLQRSRSKNEIIEASKKLLLFDEYSLRLQRLAAMNVEMAFVYIIDFALSSWERSSGTMKKVSKLRSQRRDIILKTPKRYYKVFEALKAQIEASRRVASRHIG